MVNSINGVLAGKGFISFRGNGVKGVKDYGYKENYLEHPIPETPVAAPGQQVPPEAFAVHAAWVKRQKEVAELKAIMRKTMNELHAMLKLHEETLPKKDASPTLHAIRAGKVEKHKNKKLFKAAKGLQGNRKTKLVYAPEYKPSYAPKIKNPPPPKKDNPAKDAICHQCGEVGHWRRNCPVYLAELLKKKKLSQEARTLGIFTIELYSFPSTSWVYDTGCGTHICNTAQGLRGSRKLKPGALSLYMGNGQRAGVEAIGSYHLCLPSGLVIVLNNSNYAPSITRGIILVSRLFDHGFIKRFENNAISVSMNNLVYFTAIPRDGIYEIDLPSSNTNDSSLYAVSNKRAKLNLDYSLLWH
ncbi:zinc finger, CCHC-type containing protein [Tanacetum coccineum]